MNIIMAGLLALTLALASACGQQQEPRSGQQQPGASPQSAQQIALLKEAAEKDPGNVNGWIQLGNMLMDASRFNEAVDAYGKALALDPKNVNVRVDMATCYKESGRPEKAVEEYRKAIEIDPAHVNAHRNLGITLLFDIKDKAGAAKEFEKYLELAPFAKDAPQVRKTLHDITTGK